MEVSLIVLSCEDAQESAEMKNVFEIETQTEEVVNNQQPLIKRNARYGDLIHALVVLTFAW